MQPVDTTGKKATGAAVVEEAIRRIHESQIFNASDYGLLRRIAWVESRDGADKNTFRDPKKEAGVGIWQMDKSTFEDIKRQAKLQKKFFGKIKKAFGIDFSNLDREDLNKPLVSALAARLQLARFKEKIPKEVDKQARYWKKYYNSNDPNAKGTEMDFLNRIKDIPSPPSEDKGLKQISSLFR